MTFSDLDEAIALTNDNNLGLVAGVFTGSMDRAIYFGEQLETGIVNINEVCTYWQPHTPFGGHSTKRSGIGRLGGKYRIMEMSQLMTLVLDIKGVCQSLTRSTENENQRIGIRNQELVLLYFLIPVP